LGAISAGLGRAEDGPGFGQFQGLPRAGLNTKATAGTFPAIDFRQSPTVHTFLFLDFPLFREPFPEGFKNPAAFRFTDFSIPKRRPDEHYKSRIMRY
jgi:hypothetical protein